jgi:hypothetical protein
MKTVAEVEAICLQMYKEFGEKSTVSYSEVPYVSLGKYGIYEVSVRYASLSFKKPTWWYNIYCGGGVSVDGFLSLEEAIDAAKKEIDKRKAEFKEKYKDILTSKTK